jgi:inhibitor of cysteine peptidase
MNIARQRTWLRAPLLRCALILGVATLLLVGCSINRDNDEDRVLTNEEDGQMVEVNQGDRIRIELESNPTTGYEWAVDSTDETILVYEGSAYEAGDGNRVGQGGIQTLTFQAAEPGQAEIHLKYWRSWEGDASVVERFDVTITITSN